MGTRNLTMVILNGEHKIAQYGQWDGYPEGQGLTCLLFLKNNDIQEFKNRVSKCSYMGEDEINKIWEEAGSEDGFISMEGSYKVKNKYPTLSRDQGAEILHLVMGGHCNLQDSSSFAADSLFCEWGYVIDLDNNKFEVYTGFNKSPLELNERFYSLQKDGSDYYPIKLVAYFDIDNLPSKEEFVGTFINSEEE